MPKLPFGLPHVFKTWRITQAWKSAVRLGLRRQHLFDLHDYLDVHRNINTIAHRLRKDVLEGRYRPREPEVVTLEKEKGVPRRIVLPDPADALLLQTLVDSLEPFIKHRQPSQSAFYSRTHHASFAERIATFFPYPGKSLWPQMQKRILGFAEAHPVMLVTDVSTYFDAIPLSTLRNKVAATAQADETVLDLLFYLLESFVWRPMYIPYSGVGLPQLNFDAPRLLAHLYLFEVDRLLEAEGLPFVRWMDDITVGCTSNEEAKRILGQIEQRLVALGVSLNMGKTYILRGEGIAEHFFIRENTFLNVFYNIIELKGDVSALGRRLFERRARELFMGKRDGQWDKIAKRYLDLLGRLNLAGLEGEIFRLLENQPAVRGAVVGYLRQQGFSPERFTRVQGYIVSGHCIDDASLFEAARLLTEWQIPRRSTYRDAAVRLALRLPTLKGRDSLSAFASGLWLLIKYGQAAQLARLLRETRDVWTTSEWGARQVAAVAFMLPARDNDWVREELIRNGLVEGLRVLAHVEELCKQTSLDKQLKPYLFHEPTEPYSYPLSKVVMALGLSQGNLTRKQDVKTRLLSCTDDPVYEELIAAAFP